MNDLTQMLRDWSAGDRTHEKPLFDVIYPVLKKLAYRQLHGGHGLTLQATEIAHESYMRLFGNLGTDINSRQHFFSLAATVVRRVVVDYLRERSAEKRGGDAQKVSLSVVTDADLPPEEPQNLDWIKLDQVLTTFAESSPDEAKIVELRYFVGMTLAEIAELRQCSSSTIERQWRFAKAWLRVQMAA